MTKVDNTVLTWRTSSQAPVGRPKIARPRPVLVPERLRTTNFRCWCPTQMLKDKDRGSWWRKRSKPSPTSQSWHQHISSPTSVTDIDVAGKSDTPKSRVVRINKSVRSFTKTNWSGDGWTVYRGPGKNDRACISRDEIFVVKNFGGYRIVLFFPSRVRYVFIRMRWYFGLSQEIILPSHF